MVGVGCPSIDDKGGICRLALIDDNLLRQMTVYDDSVALVPIGGVGVSNLFTQRYSRLGKRKCEGCGVADCSILRSIVGLTPYGKSRYRDE